MQRIEIAGDWGATLSGIEIPDDLAPWRLGVVLEAQRTKAVVGLRPARQADGSSWPIAKRWRSPSTR